MTGTPALLLICVQAPPTLPALPLDRARMRLLLRNLLDNSLRHSEPGVPPPELHLRWQNEAVEIVVRDHGPGVPPEHLAQLAQAFYRPDSARQRATGGVGLGLYLCRLVAQAHGGRLELRNAGPGRGAGGAAGRGGFQRVGRALHLHYTDRMKTATLPPVRIEPAFRSKWKKCCNPVRRSRSWWKAPSARRLPRARARPNFCAAASRPSKRPAWRPRAYPPSR